jgi:hypothetical protein
MILRIPLPVETVSLVIIRKRAFSWYYYFWNNDKIASFLEFFIHFKTMNNE